MLKPYYTEKLLGMQGAAVKRGSAGLLRLALKYITK